MAGIVITDASPLIGLSRVNGLNWIGPIFGAVWMPMEVRSEVLSGIGNSDEQEILAADQAGVLKLWPQATPTTPDLPDLDEGEAACIRLGLGCGSRALLLMDDRFGRMVAQEQGLQVAGTAAIIGMAKSRKLITSARAIFARLHASDFRISVSVIETVLKRVGE